MSAAEKISITLTPEMNRLIKKRVDAGEFASSSELIREALRLWQRQDEEHRQRLAEIRARIKAAMDDPRPGIPAKDVFDRLRAHHESKRKQRG
jgi:antitoxin ParD1/3/4